MGGRELADEDVEKEGKGGEGGIQLLICSPPAPFITYMTSALNHLASVSLSLSLTLPHLHFPRRTFANFA